MSFRYVVILLHGLPLRHADILPGPKETSESWKAMVPEGTFGLLDEDP